VASLLTTTPRRYIVFCYYYICVCYTSGREIKVNCEMKSTRWILNIGFKSMPSRLIIKRLGIDLKPMFSIHLVLFSRHSSFCKYKRDIPPNSGTALAVFLLVFNFSCNFTRTNTTWHYCTRRRKTKSWLKKQTYTKTETWKLYSGVFWIFLPNVIKIDPYNFELYCFKVCAFLDTQCSRYSWDFAISDSGVKACFHYGCALRCVAREIETLSASL